MTVKKLVIEARPMFNEARIGSLTIKLTRAESEVFAALAKIPGRTVSAFLLMEAIRPVSRSPYDYEHSSLRDSLCTCLSKLRKKLKLFGAEIKIECVYNKDGMNSGPCDGWRLVQRR